MDTHPADCRENRDYYVITAKPRDSRCRYWCKVVDGADLPAPRSVLGASSLPGEYEDKGDTVIVDEGQFVFEGEAMHHRKNRGWAYWVWQVQRDENGCLRKVRIEVDNRADKVWLADHGRRDLTEGRGEVAACVRAAFRRHLESQQ